MQNSLTRPEHIDYSTDNLNFLALAENPKMRGYEEKVRRLIFYIKRVQVHFSKPWLQNYTCRPLQGQPSHDQKPRVRVFAHFCVCEWQLQLNCSPHHHPRQAMPRRSPRPAGEPPPGAHLTIPWAPPLTGQTGFDDSLLGHSSLFSDHKYQESTYL